MMHKTTSKVFTLAFALCVSAAAATASTEAAEDVWAGYLDYAYVYSSADPTALAARLGQYASEAGTSLEEYTASHFAEDLEGRQAFEEVQRRRAAIAYLLLYISTRDIDHLERSLDRVDQLDAYPTRPENRYWSKYIRAQAALAHRDAQAFETELIGLWIEVVVPLESSFESLRTMSLAQFPGAGFSTSLPYIYENISRLILIRSPQMRLEGSVDRLAVVLRMLMDGRVGAFPDVIPPAASSRDYLDRIVRRLDRPESDAGSLTFTLSLLESRKLHDEARSLLATSGLSKEAIQSYQRAASAYRETLRIAQTPHGIAEVFISGLRQIGELYAARGSSDPDPNIQSPFRVAKAIQLFASLHDAGLDAKHSPEYRKIEPAALVDTMRRLWEEIQETSLNIAAFHLEMAASGHYDSAGHLRTAARVESRYIDFFARFAGDPEVQGLPNSAFFAAYEAAKNYGDIFTAYAAIEPSETELELAARRYMLALRLYPFDANLWPSMRSSLDRQGRVNDYLSLVLPIANSVVASSAVDNWIQQEREGAQRIEALRNALSADLGIMYLGFANNTGVDELEDGLATLKKRRDQLVDELAKVDLRLGPDDRQTASVPAAPASGANTANRATSAVDRIELSRRREELSAAISRLDDQIRGRADAIPHYRQALESDELTPQLSMRRDHPVHEMLRKLYNERGGRK